MCYAGKVTSLDRSETSLFGNGVTKVTFTAAFPFRLIAVIAAMRTIPSIRESTRYWMMRFSANMTNDDPSKFDLASVSRRRGYSPTVPPTLLATAVKVIG